MPQPDYCTIPLTQGQVAIVDAGDFQMLLQWKWYALWSPAGKTFYATRRHKVGDKKYRLLGMHRLLLGLEYGDHRHGDHINRDTLDNRRVNLRIATPAQNAWNTRLYSTNTSGHKGVYWEEQTGKWRASIGVNRKEIKLGRFSSLDAAVAAYAEASKQYHGEFARLK